MKQTTFKTAEKLCTNSTLAARVLNKLSKTGANGEKFKGIDELTQYFSTDSDILNLQHIIKHSFKCNDRLVRIFSHRSFVHECRFEVANYERLEFLGDAVLDLIVTDSLLYKFKELKEGELSRFRGALVNETSLSEISRLLGIDKMILMGKGEVKKNGMNQPAVLADVFEALLGAIYLEQGLDGAKESLDAIFEYYREMKGSDFYSLEKLSLFDAKSRLQEVTMALYKLIPEYRSEELADLLGFKVSLYIGNIKMAEVENKSKKQAERQLAFTVLNDEKTKQLKI